MYSCGAIQCHVSWYGVYMKNVLSEFQYPDVLERQ